MITAMHIAMETMAGLRTEMVKNSPNLITQCEYLRSTLSKRKVICPIAQVFRSLRHQGLRGRVPLEA